MDGAYRPCADCGTLTFRLLCPTCKATRPTKERHTMDPDETLKEIRRLTEQVDNDPSVGAAAVVLAELVTALDGWLTAGGFLPAAWAGFR